MISFLRHLCLCSVIFSILVTPGFALNSDEFPVSDSMRVKVDFWKKVYTEISSTEGFLHDDDNLNIIYDKLEFPGYSRRRKIRLIRRKKRELRRAISRIARKKRKDQELNENEKALYQKMGEPDWKQVRRMARQVRFQQGLRDRYYRGLISSYQYLDRIKNIFNEYELPKELIYLPHVESSFNYRAYSKVGAAGIWQFMRYTGRLYGLKMNYIIDERRDPIKSTRAAARLLRDNYTKLKAWPLALTAYNHGPNSIARAVKKTGSRDISVIVEKYNGRRFGFASKNFYATFVATVEISQEPEEYFKEFQKPEPFLYSEIELPQAMTVRQISKVAEITRSTIRKYNLSLRPIAFRSNLYVPKGYQLKIPVFDEEKIKAYEKKIASAKIKKRDLQAGGTHIVSRGESLFLISKIYKVRVTDLIVLNEISNPGTIRPGDRIKIPGKEDRIELAKSKKAKEQKPEIPDQPIVLLSRNESEDQQGESASELSNEEPKSKGLFAKFFGMFDRSIDSESEAETAAADKELDETVAKPEISPESYNLDVQQVGEGLYRVTVEPEETLGHYAEWAKVPTWRVRRANNMSSRSTIRHGQKILIPMEAKKLVQFNLERMQFHLAIEEDFYANYQVAGMSKYVVKRGDTIDTITRELEVPYWLIRKHQPKDFDHNLQVGEILQIPQVTEAKTTEG